MNEGISTLTSQRQGHASLAGKSLQRRQQLAESKAASTSMSEFLALLFQAGMRTLTPSLKVHNVQINRTQSSVLN